MFNKLGELEHMLDIILKFQFKKVSMTVEMVIQHDDFHKFIRINSMQNNPQLIVVFLTLSMLYSAAMTEKCE